MSEKGRKKTSEELLRELVPLIEEAEAAQMKDIQTLLVEGATIKHKLKDEDRH